MNEHKIYARPKEQYQGTGRQWLTGKCEGTVKLEVGRTVGIWYEMDY